MIFDRESVERLATRLGEELARPARVRTLDEARESWASLARALRPADLASQRKEAATVVLGQTRTSLLELARWVLDNPSNEGRSDEELVKRIHSIVKGMF